MHSAEIPDIIPDILLIIGTDAAGKDHVANIVEKMMLEAGYAVEKRKRYLTGKVTRESSSTCKGRVELFLEKCFILFLPYLGFLLPAVLNLVMRKDIRRYRQTGKKIIVIGHNCLRGLALHWGLQYEENGNIPISHALEATLHRMRNMKGFHALVLDVEDRIRKERIVRRELNGEADNFDRFMVENSIRSERIENVLVWICRKYLGASLIANNDLSEEELRGLIMKGFSEK